MCTMYVIVCNTTMYLKINEACQIDLKNIHTWRVLSQNDLGAIFEIFEVRAQLYNTK